jgi:peptidoglycan/xylan/chitin deacetylase (PgdA/CDA1 family)
VTLEARIGAPFRHIAFRLLRFGWVGEAIRRIGAARGHSLVLVYHRVGPCREGRGQIVPCIPASLFRRHVEILMQLGEVVPLEDLLDAKRPRRRACFALTFDDDYATHFTHVLPTLREFEVTATFFLSGRALHGLGSYWFERLEDLIEMQGPRRVADLIGTSEFAKPSVLAAMCESDLRLQQLIERSAPDTRGPLGLEQIRALADAGMTVGFHTLHHSPLTSLADADLRRALTLGRKELAVAAGGGLPLFAYPHGSVDDRVARAVRSAGFAAAWTGLARPMRRSDDRYLLGRWEPGRLPIDDFVVKMGLRLNRTTRQKYSVISQHA